MAIHISQASLINFTVLFALAGLLLKFWAQCRASSSPPYRGKGWGVTTE
jgi:hypothetical protein